MTKTFRLTNQIIESTTTVDKDRWLSDDDGNRGWGRLLLRVSSNEDRRFYFRYSIDGLRTTLALGRYVRKPSAGFLTLGQARKIATTYSALHRDPLTRDVKQHIAPSEIKSRNSLGAPDGGGAGAGRRSLTPPAAPAPTEKPSHTLLDLCNVYAGHLAKRGAQSARQVKNYIKNHIAPTDWAGLTAREIKPKDVTALLRLVIEAGKGSTANKVRQALHAAYGLAIKAPLDAKAPSNMDAFGIEINPVSATASLADLAIPGDRALDRTELGHFWATITSSKFDLSMPVRFVRLTVLLGGQRALQLLRCSTDSVDLDVDLITLMDNKGRRRKPRVHGLPLADAAKKEVEWLLLHSKSVGSPYLFAGRSAEKALTEGPVSRIVRHISDELQAAKSFKAAFRYTDIRRTIETNMASLGISKDTRAQIQSHGLGGIQTKHYDRHDYYRQKWKALTRWEKFLGECAAAVASRDSEQL